MAGEGLSTEVLDAFASLSLRSRLSQCVPTQGTVKRAF